MSRRRTGTFQAAVLAGIRLQMLKSADQIAGVSRHIATSSALNPTLLLCAICTPLAFILTAVVPQAFRLPFFIVGATPVAVAIIQIIWFTFSDTDRLQHDRHIENKMMISRFGNRVGDETEEIFLPASRSPIVNPIVEGEQH